MRKTLFLAVSLCLFASFQAGAWSMKQHAAIAYIAEQHMSPKAKAKVSEYLNGQSMVAYASHLDLYKQQMIFKLKEPYTYKGKKERTIPHVFRLDENMQTRRWYGYECMSVIEESIQNLEHYKELDDSTRTQSILNLIHLVGDIHCPSHTMHADNRDRKHGYFDVTYRGETYRFHSIWDNIILDSVYAGGVYDLAYLADRYNKKGIKEIQIGSIWDWGADIGARTQHIWVVENGAELDIYYMLDNAELCLDQIARAGYRLAKVMDDLFK